MRGSRSRTMACMSRPVSSVWMTSSSSTRSALRVPASMLITLASETLQSPAGRRTRWRTSPGFSGMPGRRARCATSTAPTSDWYANQGRKRSTPVIDSCASAHSCRLSQLAMTMKGAPSSQPCASPPLSTHQKTANSSRRRIQSCQPILPARRGARDVLPGISPLLRATPLLPGRTFAPARHTGPAAAPARHSRPATPR